MLLCKKQLRLHDDILRTMSNIGIGKNSLNEEREIKALWITYLKEGYTP